MVVLLFVAKANTPKFQSDLYYRARPFYPAYVFAPLFKTNSNPGSVLDLGCGTGQSIRSYRDALKDSGTDSSDLFAVDPDEKMLAQAKSATNNITYLVGSAESIPLPNSSVDTLLIGSAIHWFILDRALEEIARVLRPTGHLFVFEYQFPKCIEDPGLHDFIKRKFNLEWKAPVQKPRGNLSEITSCFRDSKKFRSIQEDRPVWKEKLGLEEFLGHLFSQSRYLHAEENQSDRLQYKTVIRESLTHHFQNGPLLFDLKPRSILFQRSEEL